MNERLLALHHAAYALSQYESPPPTPALRVHDPGLQSTNRDTISTALLALKNDMDRTDHVLRLPHAEKQSLRLRRTALQAVIEPMSSLPPELMRVIFALAIESAYCPMIATQTALSISHTSSVWRAVALSQSAIWARADFQRFHPSLAKLWVERSRHRPLRLTLHSAEVELGTVLGHADVLRLTYLAISDEEDADDALPGTTVTHQLASLAGATLPVLETLWIQSTHSQMSETFTTIDMNAFHLVVPALRDLRLFGVSIKTFASLGHALTSLRLESVSGSIPEWAEMMTSCSFLETLIIDNGVSQSAVITEPIEPWLMVHLRTLVLQDCDTVTVHALLQNLEAPNLHEFSGGFCDDIDEPENPEQSLLEGGEIGDELCFLLFPSFLRRSPHLQSMTMRGLTYRLVGFIELIQLGFSRYPETLAELRSLTIESIHLPEDEWHPEYASDWQTGTEWLAIAVEALAASLALPDASGIRHGHLENMTLSSSLIIPGGVTSSSSIALVTLPDPVEFEADLDNCGDLPSHDDPRSRRAVQNYGRLEPILLIQRV